MKLLTPLAGLALLCLPLAGCADLQAIVNTAKTVADAQIPANVAVAAANGYDAIEILATPILVTCTPTPTHVVPAVCVSQKANIRSMSAAVLAGRPIRNAIEPSPGVADPISKTAYDKLQSIIATITSAVNAFNSAKG